MTDILEQDASSPPSFFTLDHVMPDDLEVGDIVFFDGDPYSFLHKEEGASPMFFKPEVRGLAMRRIMPTEYIRKTRNGEAKRPGRKGIEVVMSGADADMLDIAYQALPVPVRRKSDLKDYYVNEFWRRIDEAAKSGKTFARNAVNAQAVIATVDAVLPDMKLEPPRMRSWRSVLRWVERSERSKRSPVANIHGNALREYERQVPHRILEIIATTIRETTGEFPHLGPKKIRIRVNDKIKEINRDEDINLPYACPTLVNDEFNRFDAWIRKAQIDGQHEADLEFGSVGKLTRPKKINMLWELDHHVVDLVPVLGETPLGRLLSTTALGRFGITVAYDVHSGYPMGFYPSFEGTGLLPALMCLSHGVQEKTYVANRFPHIEGALLGHGKPIKVRFDRAPEFIGRQMALALGRVGIGFEFARPSIADDKPYVERHFGTLSQDFLGWMKGRTGSSPRKRGAADPMLEASIHLDDIMALYHEYLITVYARRKQAGLDWDTPEERWLRGLKVVTPRLLNPDEQSRVDVLASVEVDVKAGREGIRWKNKFYQSPALQAIRKTSGDHGARKKQMTPLTARVPLRNVGMMFVSVPGAKPPREIAVPCTKATTHGRTMWQDEVIEALLLKKKKDPTSGPDYEEGFAQLFKRSLNYMGVDLDGSGAKPGSAKAAATAARFAGVMIDGVAEHALSRVEQEAVRLDIFKEVEASVAKAQASGVPKVGKRRSPTVKQPEMLVDDIDVSDFLDDGEDA
ncbi:hypothetical protein [Methylobacterium sp. J-070]|uniref:hypothetical protein n=1 Tax=Methylobacterium sp. J-070 TaxID=2836650 RepID=UPI001FBBB515|nr:hypothetical protein [Methylobacterium sp. J-070]MCJ2050529.1 hypothetical protein [Methylobacterium sp. J-070]